MLIDFILSPYTIGFERGLPRLLDPFRLCNDPRGLSGTEVNALGLAQELAKQGHHMRLWSHWRYQAEFHVLTGRKAPYNGRLHYVQLAFGPPNTAPDVAVAFHDATPLRNWPAGLKVVWHQTLTPPHYELMPTEEVDLYLSATQRNAAHLAQYTGDKPWAVVPNGWDVGTFPPHKPIPGRLFYHTSPERGLHLLLQALPAIRARVPEAHLVAWCRMQELQYHHHDRWQAIMEGLERCKGLVEFHDSGGSRNEVLASLATAACVAYPSDPPMPCEVMPVSLMEACAIGVPVVTAPSDGFEAAFGDAIITTPSPPSQHLEEFIHDISLILLQDFWARDREKAGRQWAQQHTFAQSAQRFQAVIVEALAQKGAAVHD